MYENIRKKSNVRDLYKEKLILENILSPEDITHLQQQFTQLLEKALAESTAVALKSTAYTQQNTLEQDVTTAASSQELLSLAQKFCTLPAHITPHPKIARLFQDRLYAIQHAQPIDWGLAEYLAYATLVSSKIPVRISGQDCRRGTFAHRHAVVVDQQTDNKYFPLAHVAPDQASFTVYNSLLSEFGVLGFEYGYAEGIEKGLTIWEAQFGDFANSAQIIIDQYISSSEQKWGVKNPLVMMLPHGYEGGGPEHSSARVERYLQLCAQHNMRVVMPSSSAQVFHLLREQGLQRNRCPLILFNPKSMLRFLPSLSPLKEFTEGGFRKIILDETAWEAKRVLLCSGKVYYDLLAHKEKLQDRTTAILRLEQLYPLSSQEIQQALAHYPHMERCLFVQEEPENMGAYLHLAPLITEILPDKIKLCYVGRARSASPAAGSLALHQQEKEKYIQEAFK
jgi:2-oxoglutarate dehydrogenase E1 component